MTKGMGMSLVRKDEAFALVRASRGLAGQLVRGDIISHVLFPAQWHILRNRFGFNSASGLDGRCEWANAPGLVCYSNSGGDAAPHRQSGGRLEALPSDAALRGRVPRVCNQNRGKDGGRGHLRRLYWKEFSHCVSERIEASLREGSEEGSG